MTKNFGEKTKTLYWSYKRFEMKIRHFHFFFQNIPHKNWEEYPIFLGRKLKPWIDPKNNLKWKLGTSFVIQNMSLFCKVYVHPPFKKDSLLFEKKYHSESFAKRTVWPGNLTKKQMNYGESYGSECTIWPGNSTKKTCKR